MNKTRLMLMSATLEILFPNKGIYGRYKDIETR